MRGVVVILMLVVLCEMAYAEHAMGSLLVARAGVLSQQSHCIAPRSEGSISNLAIAPILLGSHTVVALPSRFNASKVADVDLRYSCDIVLGLKPLRKSILPCIHWSLAHACCRREFLEPRYTMALGLK